MGVHTFFTILIPYAIIRLQPNVLHLGVLQAESAYA